MRKGVFYPEFSTASALEHARKGFLRSWIYRYLGTGEWANPGLLQGLQQQQRWWIGPIEIPLHWLERACGPEPGMEYRISQMDWEAQVLRIAARLTEPLAAAPLIAEYRVGRLSLRDGNHRHEAMRRKGWPKCWVLIWHNSCEDFEESLLVLRSQNVLLVV